jgi:RND family efflux transporter MFP subunit
MTSRRSLLSLLTVLGLALIGVVGAGLWPRLNKERVLLAEAKTESSKLPVVRVVRVQRAEGSSQVEMPADLQALIESPIYARVEGYISKRNVDIGWKVKKGQILAELETPELDQQLRQARAAVSQSAAALKQTEARLMESRAGLKLAQVTAERWKKLVKEGVSSKQEADEKEAAFEVKQAETEAVVANVAAAKEAQSAAEASLSRLEELKSFSKLPAPFDGIITFRHPDVGTLITAGAASQRELFRVADISTIRVFVNVPQAYVNSIRPGTPAQLRIDDLNKTFNVTVGGIANALDMNSRTMLAVIRIPNPDGSLMPGMFSRVMMKLPNPPTILTVPSDTVVSRNEGTFVAVVRPDRHVQFQKIMIARDTGASVEISSGVKEGDMLITNPNDEIRENVMVDVRAEPSATARKAQ